MMIDPDAKGILPQQDTSERTDLPGIGQRPAPSTRSDMDAALTVLQEHKDTWANLPVAGRLRILDGVMRDYGALSDHWVSLGLAAKQCTDPYDVGMEWTGGPLAILRYLRRLRMTLESIEKNGRPSLGPSSVRSNGQVVARIFPRELYERLSTPGVTVEVWLEPGLAEPEVRDSIAAPYVATQPRGKVALVLGAGNVSGIPVNDTLTRLFVENHVVLLKMNPINDYLGPLIEKGLRQLIDEGFLRVVYGDAAEGTYLCHHAGVDEVHLTGSARTYEAIVFGGGPEGVQRKKERRPVVTKRFTAELGNIGPAIVVPGPWSAGDVGYQSEQLASHLCDNASYSCSRTRIIVQHSAWPQRQQLLDGIKSALGKIPSRAGYYPGGAALYQRFLSAHPEAERFGSSDDGKLPWALIANIDSRQQSDICFETESFCPVIAETAVDAASPADFIDRAVEFANERLWGTLSATIIVHPRSLRDPAVLSALERALDHLRYGVITINCTPGLAWAITTPPWGSYPGNPPWDIQSGCGFAHNPLMFARPQKVVVRAPFRTWPRPIWFPSRATAFRRLIRDAAGYELDRSWRRMLKIAWTAIRS